MADPPKYVESLRGEIAVLDRKIGDFNEKLDQKIGDFNEKFDQKIDRLYENLHEVESALTEVCTTLKTFIQRVDKSGDRQWQLFLAVIGLTATFLVASAASFWQVQQHGKQLEKLEGAITRLDGSVAKIPSLEQQIGKLEKSVEKIGGLETTIVRLDQSVTQHGKQLEVLGGAITRLNESVAKIPSLEQQIGRLEKSVERIGGLETTIVRLDQSLALHGRQLEKLEKSVDKIAGLEIAIIRLDGSVTRLANLEKTLPDLAGSIKESLALSRVMEQRLAAIEHLQDPRPRSERAFLLDLGSAQLKAGPRPEELIFEWALEPRLAYRVKPGQEPRIVFPAMFPKIKLTSTDSGSVEIGIVPRTDTEIIREGDRTILRIRASYPKPEVAEAIRKLLFDPAEKKKSLVVDPTPPD